MPQPKMYTEETMEDYLLGRLPSDQRLKFEEALHSDPDLLFECNWQRQIIWCVRLYRKTQLKQRLSVIPV